MTRPPALDSLYAVNPVFPYAFKPYLRPMLKLIPAQPGRSPIWVVDKNVSLGTADDNTLKLTDASASPHHARLILNDRRYLLRDLDSDQGTFVNGQRIKERLLQHGDHLRLGTEAFEVQDPYRADTHTGWILVASSGWLSGRTFPIRARDGKASPGTVVKIGRGSHCDILLTGTHLSRDHAQFTLTDSGLILEDRQMAGTFINDQPVTQGMVHNGDTLRLDIYRFAVFGPGATPQPAAQTAPASSPPDEAAASPQAASEKRPASPAARRTSSVHAKNPPAPIGTRRSLGTALLAGLLGLAVIGLCVYLLLG